MLYLPITAETLHAVANDAKSRNQFAIVIWATESHWRNLREKFDQSNNMYKAMAEQVQAGCHMFMTPHEMAGQKISKRTEKVIRSLAVPAEKLADDFGFCKYIAELCEQEGIYGPITNVPSMRLNMIHLKS